MTKKTKLKYFGAMLVEKAYGGWIRKIKDPETVSIRINKTNVVLLINYFVAYLNQGEDSPIILTV